MWLYMFTDFHAIGTSPNIQNKSLFADCAWLGWRSTSAQCRHDICPVHGSVWHDDSYHASACIIHWTLHCNRRVWPVHCCQLLDGIYYSSGIDHTGAIYQCVWSVAASSGIGQPCGTSSGRYGHAESHLNT